MGNEKQILINNMEWNKSRGKQNGPPMAGLPPKKVILCTWWDWKGIFYYKPLPEKRDH